MNRLDRKPQPVSAFFQRLGDLFVQGRIREMTGSWAYPCPVEVQGGLVVMRNAAMMEAFLAMRHADAIQRGLTAMIPRIAAIEMPRKERFRVWLRWEYEFRDQCVPDEYGSLYYLARNPWGTLTIEMLDVVHVPPFAAQADCA
ncbi:hypothetical protein [Rubellimicrobium arenae]|uniref:hypothetical protein n=1 Tax=Rubellimicrobium arenae TaxID=2817372 RepID=UPI001B30CA5C|nr:hypothetical protein [Rubellimicrobium arenae]